MNKKLSITEQKKLQEMEDETLKTLELSFRCGQCTTISKIPLKDVGIRSYSQECDMCGSHGTVRLDFRCPECGFYPSLMVKDW